jgi:5-bromo-4-chloroindolyl phosphate hydrolysis protein
LVKKIFILFLVGTAVFAALFKFTILGFLLSSVAGVGSMLLLGSLISLIQRVREGTRKEAAPAPARAAGDVVKEGMEKLRRISNTARMIQSNEVAGKIREICRVGAEIFDGIKKSPGKIGKVKQFTNYYLDATGKNVEAYAEVANKTNRSPEVEQALRRVEDLLDTIRQTFDRHLANLLEDNLLDTNTELTVLKNTMKMEG